MAEVLHLMYKTLENQEVLLQDCSSTVSLKISPNKFCLHEWVSCRLILMVECYTFTVYPRNHSHDDRKIWHLQLGFIFKETVQWKQLLLLTTWTLSCRTMATLSSQKFKPDSVLQSSVADFQLEQKKHIQPQKNPRAFCRKVDLSDSNFISHQGSKPFPGWGRETFIKLPRCPSFVWRFFPLQLRLERPGLGWREPHVTYDLLGTCQTSQSRRNDVQW